MTGSFLAAPTRRAVAGALLLLAASACTGSEGSCQCVTADGGTVMIDNDGDSCSELVNSSTGYQSCEPVVPINSLFGPKPDIETSPAGPLPPLDRAWWNEESRTGPTA